MSDDRSDPPRARRSRGRAVPAGGRPRESPNFPIVGIGASAGGLDACSKLVEALPPGTGMAFILVQHLDPTHESMMVDLLSDHTVMNVRQATDGMPIEAEHLYIIPPGTYLSARDGALHLSEPRARHGARLPFDFLLHSLAEEYGARAICVILSGTGADGSLGLKAVKEKGGLVIAQDPDEAGYGGMPRSALTTGAVDLVLPVAGIADALVTYGQRMALGTAPDGMAGGNKAPDRLAEIVDLLRNRTAHDFTLYKPGTLERRIERRMAMAGIAAGSMARYVRLLQNDKVELDLLGKDLLINVTSFFRDPAVFDLLSEKIVPALVRNQPLDQPLRIWIAGCSTGEETYSLAMLFHEALTAAQRNIKLQVFASDVDPDAVAQAREGVYPETIEAEVSPERLARFFTKETHAYRVSSELRAVVIFTVQDVLADPPFSRLDLVSCRNLLIYLRPEAQAKVISLFHFALREDGLLLLGGAETVGNFEDHFRVISKPARLYRHIRRSRPGELSLSMNAGDVRVPPRPGRTQLATRQAALADLCRRLVMETYAPAAVLIDHRHECLYSVGPTDRYLRMAPGHPTHDLLAMARGGLRNKLRSAIQQAKQANARVVVAGCRMTLEGKVVSFSIAVQPVLSEGEALLLIAFIDEPARERRQGQAVMPQDLPRLAELEEELEATRTELQSAIRNLEISGEEQMAVNEEALSVNEEYQSTNEELLTSKEELQSLNEELTALNSQLQETLERQRTTSNDLQNVLYSTEVATLFLDTDLKIRFFTPATRSLFNVIPTDIGRPLADLTSLAAEGALPADALEVLRNSLPLEREIEAQSGIWFIRRILPYRTEGDGVEGVVITFTDITERKRAAKALEAAKQQAEAANAAKSRFLAAASHDLRQPLQTLALLQALLAKNIQGEPGQKLITRLDETLGAMAGMLNALLNINQIEAGTVRAEMSTFPLAELFDRLRDEFTYHAQAKRLTLRVVPCNLSIHSDPHLLEQMIRNLLSNALKYTRSGKVLLGCRRHEGMLSVEIWDTGIGIPEAELQAIFEEYHQLDNPARERSRGLGLGLAIVQRLEKLLGHRVRVRSRPGKGSVFAIEIALPPSGTVPPPEQRLLSEVQASAGDLPDTGLILVIEDDPEVRELLELFLLGEGHRVVAVSDGVAAMDLIRGTVRPDLILTDYNLPNGMDGLKLAAKLRERLHFQVPVIILTGDISTGTLGSAGLPDCVSLNKPVKLTELTQAIQRLLAVPRSRASHPAEAIGRPGPPIIFVVDDDSQIRETIRAVLEEEGRKVEDYASCEAFLDAFRPGLADCLLVDAYLPGMNGLELLGRLKAAGHQVPAIMITGTSDVPMAVRAMKAGASDFIEKPIGRDELLAAIDRALEQSRDASKLSAAREVAISHVAGLTQRQREIMDLVLAGHPSKNIAADLGISQRTVENHRAQIMRRTGAKSLPALARLALTAAAIGADEPAA